jgi:hypothetical protein
MLEKLHYIEIVLTNKHTCINIQNYTFNIEIVVAKECDLLALFFS